MWRKWYTWVSLLVLAVSLFCWMDTELKILDSIGNNEAWIDLSTEKDQSANGLAVSAMKQLLINNDLTSEQKFADLMLISRSYAEPSYMYRDSYELYWLAISDTLVDYEETNKAADATRRLLFADQDFNQKMTDMMTVVDYGVNGNTYLTNFGRDLRCYAKNRSNIKEVILGKLDYKTLLVQVDRTWEWLWIVSLLAFISVAWILIADERSKKKNRNNQNGG